MYKIIRCFAHNSPRFRTITKGLTLEEARAWCHDPETSSRTCKSAYKRRYTREHGAWFDGYRQED